jgi:hypothetical protein
LWHKANRKYEKRPEEQENDLSVWKADHAEMVRQRAAQLTEAGYQVSLEDQNKFFVHGRTATLAGCPDIMARMSLEQWRIDDVKTGRQRDSDYWQVVIYMLFAPIPDDECPARVVDGTVVYRDTQRIIGPEHAGPSNRQRVLDIMKIASNRSAPPATPSGRECSMCDIAQCPYRIQEPVARAVNTEDF